MTKVTQDAHQTPQDAPGATQSPSEPLRAVQDALQAAWNVVTVPLEPTMGAYEQAWFDFDRAAAEMLKWDDRFWTNEEMAWLCIQLADITQRYALLVCVAKGRALLLPAGAPPEPLKWALPKLN
jgi:hypothetical protein